MRKLFLVAALSILAFVAHSSLSAQLTRFGQRNESSAKPNACGPTGVKFKITLDQTRHAIPAPAPGKAQVVFIHEDGTDENSWTYPTIRIAADGAWVGANHQNTWFALSIDPGVHHFCTNMQTNVVEARTVLAHVDAEAGKTYYFRTRLIMSRAVELLELTPIDSDEGEHLVALLPMSVSKANK